MLPLVFGVVSFLQRWGFTGWPGGWLLFEGASVTVTGVAPAVISGEDVAVGGGCGGRRGSGGGSPRLEGTVDFTGFGTMGAVVVRV